MARYALIRKNDIANGLGIRTTFWVQGCVFKCPQCHNKEQWDFNGGYEFTKDTINEIVESISADGVMRDFTILGGEPFAKENVQMCIDVIDAVREKYPSIDIWIYSGFTFEHIIEHSKRKELVSKCDVLVDGQFVQELYDIKLKFKGSSNQRIIDVKRSLDKNSIKVIGFK